MKKCDCKIVFNAFGLGYPVEIEYCDMHRDAPRWARYFFNKWRNEPSVSEFWYEQYKQLEADNARLRELIKSVEWAGLDQVNCPWCEEDDWNKIHSPNCPAFNPDGTVK